MSNQTGAMTKGVHHVGLTVPSIEKARDFFVEILGFSQVGAVPEYPAIFVSDGTVMITLWRALNPETAVAFDRKANIGLHHLALTVDESDLPAILNRLQECKDVELEFEPQSVGGLPAKHMMCCIPGGIRVEFLAIQKGG